MVDTLLVFWKAKLVSTQEALTVENIFIHGFLSLGCSGSLLLSFSLLCFMFTAERKKHLLLPCLQLPEHLASCFFVFFSWPNLHHFTKINMVKHIFLNRTESTNSVLGGTYTQSTWGKVNCSSCSYPSCSLRSIVFKFTEDGEILAQAGSWLWWTKRQQREEELTSFFAEVSWLLVMVQLSTHCAHHVLAGKAKGLLETLILKHDILWCLTKVRI